MSSNDKRTGHPDGSDPEERDDAAGTERTSGEDTVQDAEIVSETGPDGTETRRDALSDDDPEREGATTPSDETEERVFSESQFPEQDMEIAEKVAETDASADKDPLPDEPDADRPNAPEGAAPASAVSAAPGTETTGSVPPVPPAPPPSSPERKGGGGFFPALLGGVIAAGAGFAVAQYDLVGMVTGETAPDPVEQSLQAQDDRLSGLEDQIGQIAEAVSQPNTGGIEAQLTTLTEDLQSRLDDVAGRIDSAAARIGTVEEQLGQSISSVRDDVSASVSSVRDDVSASMSSVQSTLGDMNDRLTAVEKRPLQESSETARQAFSAYEREVEELQTALADQRTATEQASQQLEERAAQAQAEVEAAAKAAEEAQAQAQAEAQKAAEEAQAQAEAARQEAEQMAQKAQAEAAAIQKEASSRAALARLDAAIERGDPFEASLNTLSDYTEIPAALSENAASGVTPLPRLQAEFPDLAREALDDSIRETVDNDPVSRVGAFLRTQTGVRSLSPKEGDDPDAVLSRIEAALSAGELETVMSEVSQLPEAGQAVLSDWAARVQKRAAVTQAAAELRTTLLAN